MASGVVEGSSRRGQSELQSKIICLCKRVSYYLWRIVLHCLAISHFLSFRRTWRPTPHPFNSHPVLSSGRSQHRHWDPRLLLVRLARHLSASQSML
jgi:hypothetical protein